MPAPNKQLAHLDAEDVRARAARDEALTLKELSVATGVAYSALRELAGMKGFPFIGKQVFPSDFKAWRRRSVAKISRGTPARLPRPSADKFGELRVKHG